MSKRRGRFSFLFLLVIFLAISACYLLADQELEGKLDSGMNAINTQVRSIGSTACGLIGAIIGLISLGRAAWKFANGENGSVMSLLEGVLAIVLAQISGGFFSK